MRYLVSIDIKSVKKILFLYYLGILGITLFVHPILGWGGSFLTLRIERDICKENMLMGIPKLYRGFPNKNLYPDEKNVFFYLVILNALFIWGIGSFIAGIEGVSGLSNKIQFIIALDIISLIICGFYHLSWICVFLKYQNIIVCMKVVRKYYIIFATIFLLFARTGYISKIVELFINNKLTGFIIIILFLFVEILCSIWFPRRVYEKSEVK